MLDIIVSNDELILYILNGLLSAFENMAATFCSRDIEIPFEELKAKLLKHDTYMKRVDSQADCCSISIHISEQKATTPTQAIKPVATKFPQSHPSRSFSPQ